MEKLINTQNTIQISVAEYERLKAIEANQANLDSEIRILREALRLARAKRFGKSTEKHSPEASAQLIRLFDEPEVIQAIEDAKNEEEAAISVSAHTRQKKTNALQDKLPENVPVEVVEHTLSEEELVCPVCGTQMQEIGVDVRRELVIIPAQVKVVEHRIHSYACMTCKEREIQTPVISAPKDTALIPGGFATAEAVAHVMTQKYVSGVPLYRQEMEWKRKGIELSRQTLSNWMLRSVELYLQPLYEKLRENLLLKDIIHADETPLTVLKPLEKEGASTCWMWLYRTGADAAHPIVLYNYQDGRGKKYPKEFLKGYHGYLQTDGYASYQHLDGDFVNVGCWVHLRRKFMDAMKGFPKGKSPDKGATAQALAYIASLYNLEKKFAKLTNEERYRKRLEQEKPILDEFFAWAKTLNAAPKSNLGKALTYLVNQEAYLKNYLEDGRLEMDNNRAERSIRPFTIGRKNFLFANTARGALGSAVVYSLIETAKENKLDPYGYLVYVLKKAKELDVAKNPECVEQLLPENAPDECRANKRK